MKILSPCVHGRGPDPKPPGGSGTRPEESSSVETREADDRILCARCGAWVTAKSRKIYVSGAHAHTFANPHGHVYNIGCFSQAPGCGGAGPLTPEFTWFSGYAWRVGVCGSCLSHLGWIFTAPSGDGFFGLILDQLVEPPD